MVGVNRRAFLKTSALVSAPQLAGQGLDPDSAIDFRYAPLSWQTAFCFPDDPYKSLVGERGELRYGHPGQGKPIDYFPVVAEFSLAGMEPDRVAWQRLEAPGVPIVHTRIERPAALVELIAFASNEPEEGRTDNVLLEVYPRSRARVHVRPLVRLRTRERVTLAAGDGLTRVRLGDGDAPVFMVCSAPLSLRETGAGFTLTAPEAEARQEQPYRVLFRFPLESRAQQAVRADSEAHVRLLENARAFWRAWRPAQGGVRVELPSRYGEFFVASARNILQARELRDGRLTFQVGPTVYRGLWVVDGHFLLEAARYLGYGDEVRRGLEATWARQEAGGGIFAGAGREHWKDTAIAMFTLVRLAELDQDWSYFRQMSDPILRGVNFLRSLRERARAEGSANGRYGLLCRGMGDGGLGGIRSEFTNTLWALAGLRAVAGAAEQLKMAELAGVRTLYEELRRAFFDAARQEMRRHRAGFDYLPMLMREDPQWDDPDEWRRPRPQVAQWALSHAIYPGLLFDREDPIVKGHIALMQAVTREDVPIETGWIPHEGLWVYNAAFAAHVYLWAGLSDWARRTFHGFLNHASPLYSWREEQPLRGSLVAGYVGDMPHNWASAECILFLRHLLALEDGKSLRLLAGVGDFELAAAERYALEATPTRFGQVDLTLEPEGSAWRLHYRRSEGPAPARLELPVQLGSRLRFSAIEGARSSQEGLSLLVDPEARRFSAAWK
jgi:hypothetical protein